MKPVVRWTIGNVKPAGFECLKWSIESFLKLYDVSVVICHNCSEDNLKLLPNKYERYNQLRDWEIKPEGVSWKLYPPRLFNENHELVIDNDIIIEKRIKEIDHFFENDSTLLLEDVTRNYGQYEAHVPENFKINSGIFGMPPLFNFEKYIKFYVKKWEINALGEYAASKTFDEQGIVATSLLNYHSYSIIPHSSVSICERDFIESNGMHFIGLNRRDHHRPYRIFKSNRIKFY